MRIEPHASSHRWLGLVRFGIRAARTARELTLVYQYAPLRIALSYAAFALWCVAGPTAARADHVDDVITALMKQRGIPGVSLTVVENSAIVREQAYGWRDKEKKLSVTPSTLFQAASVSKAVSALGVLRLVEEGKISLDENINGKLRSWRIPKNDFTRARPVTMRLILSHNAGVTVHGFEGYEVGAPIPSLLQILDGKPPANSRPICVDQVPGTKYCYSGGGYLIMQQMMDRCYRRTVCRLYGEGRFEAARHDLEHIRPAAAERVDRTSCNRLHRFVAKARARAVAY